MSKFDEGTLRAVFAKTDGRCHLCGAPIAWSNYAAHGTRGAWEIDHSVPVADGGTDHLNNLLPAHTSCNRSKQRRSSRAARITNGRTRAPLSPAAIERERLGNAATGAFAGGLIGARFGGPVGFWIGVIVGGVTAYAVDPEAA